MPTYDFKCPNCDNKQEIFLSINSLESHKQTCYHCGQQMKQIITGGRGFFQRSPFPTEDFEHADYTPRSFRDKIELRDHCEEVGLRSRLIEDGDVPLQEDVKMTSVVTITFIGQKDFTVEIDNIESISPRGLEMAFNQVEKTYRGIKGVNVFRLKRDAEEEAKKVEEDKAKALRITQLEQEEMGKYREAVHEAAIQRFDKMNKDEREALINNLERESTDQLRKRFLANIEKTVADPKVETVKVPKVVKK